MPLLGREFLRRIQEIYLFEIREQVAIFSLKEK